MNKKLLLIIIVFLVGLSFNVYANKITVAVVDFTNNTQYSLKGIEGNTAELVTTYLINETGYRVVEREKLKSIFTEHGFVQSGLVDQSETATKIGKLLGAEYMITGSLVNLDIEEKKFSGYGVETKNVTLTLDLNIKVISVTTGEIEVGKIYSSSESYQGYTSHSISIDIESKIRTLLKRITQKFVYDLKNLDSKNADTNEILVEFKSTPVGASIEIDGIYVDTTPAKIPVEEGIHSVLITLGGYEPWNKKVKIFEGFSINANLGEKIENKDDNED